MVDLNALKLTNRYWGVIDDQTYFRPFPQWIKVHSSVDQGLNKEKHKPLSATYEHMFRAGLWVNDIIKTKSKL